MVKLVLQSWDLKTIVTTTLLRNKFNVNTHLAIKLSDTYPTKLPKWRVKNCFLDMIEGCEVERRGAVGCE